MQLASNCMNRDGGVVQLVAWRCRTTVLQPMTVFWSRAQHHVTTSLMKLAIGERNVATNLGTIFRLC